MRRGVRIARSYLYGVFLLGFGMLLSLGKPVEAQEMRSADSLALVEFYFSTNGENWDVNTGWLTDAPVSQWHGVTTGVVGGERVVNWLSLFDNNLSGKIPELNLPNLQALLIEDNQIVDVADLSALSQLQYVQFENNLLSFEDLEPNINKIGYEVFWYWPQKTIPRVNSEPLYDGATLSINVGGEANIYEWRKDGQVIPGATSSAYMATVPGTYQCCVSNSIVTNLTICSEAFMLDDVTVSAPYEGAANSAVALFLHPSIAVDYLRVEYRASGASNPELSIYDVLGKKLSAFRDVRGDAGVRTRRILVGDLTPGIYFCELRDGETVLVERFIVQ